MGGDPVYNPIAGADVRMLVVEIRERYRVKSLILTTNCILSVS